MGKAQQWKLNTHNCSKLGINLANLVCLHVDKEMGS